jgi:hypothetical protein
LSSDLETYSWDTFGSCGINTLICTYASQVDALSSSYQLLQRSELTAFKWQQDAVVSAILRHSGSTAVRNWW